MTLAALLDFPGTDPAKRTHWPSLNAPAPDRLSVIVPVRDNPAGVARLLQWWEREAPGERPRELVLVDDGSRVPLACEGHGVRVLRAPGRGPAAARNLGWREASGEWCGFVDSDCVPDRGWAAALSRDWSGEIAIQGAVRASGNDRVSRFYDTQQILQPMLWTDDGRPSYLITANACVHRRALEAVGGFDEEFQLAAGEDVELGLRLSALGLLRWNPWAGVTHDYEPSLRAFFRRFFRYGRGNWVLATTVRDGRISELRPRPFIPKDRSPASVVLSGLAFGSLWTGWWFERLNRRGR